MAKSNTPRISVNKLAEYMVSKGARQRQILRDQKFPQEFKGMYYREATEAISTCLASALQNTAVLATKISVLEQVKPEKAGTLRRVNANIDAIEGFESMLDAVDLQKASPELGEHQPDKLTIFGVEVSVRPEIVLRGTGKGAKPLLGACKLHFPRTFPLRDDSAGYVSAILQRYSSDKLLDGDEAVAANYCFVLDIGTRKCFAGVKSISARLKDVDAECQNIAALWPSITSGD